MQVNDSSVSFFDKFAEYTKDGKVSTQEYDSLKSLYIQQTGATEQQFNDTIAPTLSNLIDTNTAPVQAIQDLIGEAVADGKLTYDEYTKIKDYYIHVLKIDPTVFDEGLEYLIRRDILDYLKQHHDEVVDISNVKRQPDQSLSDVIQDAIQRSIAQGILDSLSKMRTESDFSEYTYKVMKEENKKLDEQPVV